MPAGAEFYNKAPRAYNERLIQLYDIDYKESVLVGYRWYETKGIAPLYPFGFGLSYTTFELSETPRPEGVPRRQAAESERHADQHGRSRGRGGRAALRHGERPDGPPAEKGAERLPESDPGPGKSAVVEFELDRQALAFWDTQSRGWKVNPGEYTLSLGTSSADIAATLPVSVK